MSHICNVEGDLIFNAFNISVTSDIMLFCVCTQIQIIEKVAKKFQEKKDEKSSQS